MEHILSLSHGKDSTASIYVTVEILGWPLDRIVTADLWATSSIPAELPPMVEYKAKAEAIIKKRWGIEVEHFMANETFEQHFYRKRTEKAKCNPSVLYGWPRIQGAWCNSDLKIAALRKCRPEKGDIQYIGIASDEPDRIARHINKPNTKLPLVEAGWTEADCRRWCEENDLLSPIYTTATRGGCWFCHNQGVNQLRMLRKNYPEYWALMLKWDIDSPNTFHPDGHTAHDFDRRFELEDKGLVPSDRTFRWEMVADMEILIGPKC